MRTHRGARIRERGGGDGGAIDAVGSASSAGTSVASSATTGCSPTTDASSGTGTSRCDGPEINDADECVPACPAVLPCPGVPCDVPGETCEYSDQLVPSCRERAWCDRTSCTWQPMAVDPSCHSSAGCPPTPDTGACDPSQWCVYEGREEVCECTPGGLFCDPHDAEHPPPCPDVAPRFGSPCDVEGEECRYGDVGCSPDSAVRHCCGGVWGGGHIGLLPC